MAHHSPELTDEMRDEALREQFGATGQFPEGKLNKLDEGEIKFGIAADAKRGLVHINFGTPVASMSLTPVQASDIAAALCTNALVARGIGIV